MELNQKDFENGVNKAKKYIAFCWENYTYSGDNEMIVRSGFVTDLMNFVQGRKNYIPNKHGKNFEQFCKAIEKFF